MSITEKYRIPEIGDEVMADHPITCLNPSRTFRIAYVEYRDGSMSVRGEETMWFGLSLIKRVDASQSTPAGEVTADAVEVAVHAFDDVIITLYCDSRPCKPPSPQRYQRWCSR
jgi:hypothetical protein